MPSLVNYPNMRITQSFTYYHNDSIYIIVYLHYSLFVLGGSRLFEISEKFFNVTSMSEIEYP
jgi:hypothetical protein